MRSGNRVVRFAGGKAQDHPLDVGDIVVMQVGGGGGYGDPLDRDAEQVQTDVAEGRVSAEQARQLYGVALTPHGEIDSAATETLRAGMRLQRSRIKIRGQHRPRGERGLAIANVHPSLLGNGQAEETWAELLSERVAAPLRVQLSASPGMAVDEIGLDPGAMDVLGCCEGDEIRVRELRRLSPAPVESR